MKLNHPSVRGIGGRLRIDVAIVPEEPLYSDAIAASQAITARFSNFNVLDLDRFPPHASLHICTIPATGLDLFSSNFRQMAHNIRNTILEPVTISSGSGGYISLKLKILPSIKEWHELALQAAVAARGSDYLEPIRSIRHSSPEDIKNYTTYGNAFVREKFDFHVSLAKVSRDDQENALTIVNEMALFKTSVKARAIHICDIGPRSEKWEVLYAFAI